MKAWQLREASGIEGLAEVELPDPRPGPGEVLIRVRATSLNYRDLVLARGGYGPKQRIPLIPLSDGAGEVVEVGPGVARVQPGDRVTGTFFQRWISGELTDETFTSALGGFLDGMFAEYVVLDAEGLVHTPSYLSDEEAACLPCAAVTAWNALMVEGGLRAGETVLVQGTGGVSLFALQIARMAGARVIATSSSDAKLERALAMGASDGINYRDSPDWHEEVRKLTGGRGVDHVVEVGGAGTLERSLRAVRRRGYVAVIGVLSGSGEINPIPILSNVVRVHGIYVGSREMFEAMNRAFALHEIRPTIDRVFAFEEARHAFEHLASGRHFGKVVIRV